MTTNNLPAPRSARHLDHGAGLSIDWLAHGALGRVDAHGVMVNLFPGNTVEGGPANLWLRLHGPSGVELAPLLGPLSPLSPLSSDAEAPAPNLRGLWRGLRITVQLRLSRVDSTWFWHVRVDNDGPAPCRIDVVSVQDIGLSTWGASRLNEHYVSHYIDLAQLAHHRQGWVLAARQNLAVDGRHPWCLMGSLRRGAAFATDALQVQGLHARAGAPPQGLVQGLPSRRLQHEHALLAIQDDAVTLDPGAGVDLGFFVHVRADHPQATHDDDLALVDAIVSRPEAQPVLPAAATAPQAPAPGHSLFATAPFLPVRDLTPAELGTLFGSARRHEETDDGELLSFFHGANAHVVLRAKELRVQRPHGHILRTGRHLVPDEAALTSTTWMAGVFHSMVTQGHVSINRCLSTVRGALGQYRSHGQRIFVRAQGGVWQQLGVPSAFEIEPDRCRWLYAHGGGLIEVRSDAQPAPHALGLQVRVIDGAAVQLRVVHHVALGGDDAGDDGLVAGSDVLTAAPPWHADAEGIFVGVPDGSALGRRFPGGGLRIDAGTGACAGPAFAQAGGDGLLFDDGHTRGLPYICIDSGEVREFSLRLMGRLVDVPPTEPGHLTMPRWAAPAKSVLATPAHRLAEIAPWYLHNALVHYLSPRGLEQYSGGGWGTRDVCQGPLEMLLALDRPAPVRDLLLRVFAAQNADGDWPQWFMFFERERDIRAGDSHGDIVFWPLLGLARYLLASGDAAMLDETVPYHAAPGEPAQAGSVWQHVERALAVIAGRRIEGTHLAAYGHGDWNDSLQPADPALRERLCSAWTVTLHHQMLGTLARALRQTGRPGLAAPLSAEASCVLADFQRLLVVDGVVSGYALFPPARAVECLLHPADTRTGVHHSLLPMMHAVLDDMLSPAQARSHLALIDAHLTGPDGARLFDRPLPYRGGPQVLFQRAETSAYFGREIGVMYMHAHLRFAEMLAHLGLAQRFFDALSLAHPIGLRERVASASARQANCYYSSSDAAFADRYEANAHYGRVADGTVALDGGWRIYSSGPGIAVGLLVGSFLGIRREFDRLVVDPVMPASLDGLVATVPLGEHRLEIEYRIGERGHGPTRLELDGSDLPFVRGHNPYRLGGAEVRMADLAPRLGAAKNRLVVYAH